MLKKKTSLIIVAGFIILFLFYQMYMLNVTWSNDMAMNNSLTGETVFNPQFKAPPYHADEAEYIIIDNKKGNLITQTCEQALRLLKKKYTTVPTLPDIEKDFDHVSTLLIATDEIDDIGNLIFLEKALEDGIHVVFCTLPDTKTKAFKKIQELIGIRDTYNRYTKEGFRLYEGLLLSGTQRFEKIKVKTQGVDLLGKCKVFASGYDEGVFDYENVPLIWRTYYKETALFVVNADFMETYKGMGILTGILSQMKDVFIYPAVNARVVMVEGFPLLSKEYDNYFQQMYNRDFKSFSRDVIWADIISLLRRLDVRTTFYYTPYRNKDYRNGPFDAEVFDFYSKEFSLNDFEIAIGTPEDPEPDSKSAVEYAMRILNENMENYVVHSAMTDYFGEYDNDHIDLTSVPVFTDGTEENAGIYYINDNVIAVPVITRGPKDDEETLFKNICYGSALGYASYSLNFNKFFEDNNFSKVYLDFSKEIYRSMTLLMTPFKEFDALTMSDAAIRIKNYLSFVPEITREGNVLTLNSQVGERTYYILKSIYPIESAENVEVKEIEKYTYMITLSGKMAKITLKNR